jgi:glycerophosphoryl diester phosphodiesterase
VFGHRGVKGHAPENTLEGFRVAKDLGVDGIEFDVHMSRDGHLVVIHDDDVERTTNGRGLVRDMTLSQLKMLDAGVKFGKEWKGAKIPTVEEVFSQIEGLKYKIEIKHGSSVYDGIEEKVISAVETAGVTNRVRITSFDYNAIYNMHKLKRRIELGIIIRGRVGWFTGIAKRVGAKWIQANYDLLEPGDVSTAHRKGINIGVWGLRDGKSVENCLRMGVDELTLDYPEVALRLIKRKAVHKQ